MLLTAVTPWTLVTLVTQLTLLTPVTLAILVILLTTVTLIIPVDRVVQVVQIPTEMTYFPLSLQIEYLYTCMYEGHLKSINQCLLETVHVTILNVYIFEKIDFFSTSVAANYLKMYTFNEFS